MPTRYAVRCSGILVLCLLLSLALPARTHASADETLQASFAAAAVEFGTPEPVLLAVSYNLSRWESHGGSPSAGAGYGLMHLTALDPAQPRGLRGDAPERQGAIDDPAMHTLARAAALLGLSEQQLKDDPAQNIRGAAALLASYARASSGGLPPTLADWYGAVAAYSGSNEEFVARSFADDVFATMRQGLARTTSEGQHLSLVAQDVVPNTTTLRALGLRNTGYSAAECPADLACHFLLAAYRLNTPDDASDYGSFDLAQRPDDGLDVRYIVIHDTEVSFERTLAGFQTPALYTSAHYVIRASDGLVAQMVRSKNVAWHAGNWYINGHSIGIEHEGFAIEGATWYSEALYRSSARLVRALAARYHIPLDRAHIIGHDEIPGATVKTHPAMHWDPGPFWDWEHYMALLGAPLQAASGTSAVITIKPGFNHNRPALSYCYQAADCRALPNQGANFVYLHSAPAADAPLIVDPYLQDAEPTLANNWGNKAMAGQQFYRVERRGDWDAIFFGGQLAWLYNPGGKAAVPGNGTLIRPRQGLESIPVYGRAYPEQSDYPPDVTPQALEPIYRMPAGQVYVASEWVPGDYYWAPTYAPTPEAATHRVVRSDSGYFRIFFNHRFAFVKAGDVEVQ